VSAFHSGFAAVVGRPNVGKSTLVNCLVGTKVSITSPRPSTTRAQVRGVLNRPDAQVVLVDTPGLHKPRSALGARMNESATSSLEDVDAVVAVVEATADIGPGDRMVVAQSVRRAPQLLLVVNKIDRVDANRVLTQLAAVADATAAAEREAGGAPVDVEYFPVSAQTGRGVDALVETLVAAMPEGPRYYPEGMVTDVAEAFWVADLVREELLHRVQDELPHSIACRVTEWEWPRVRCEILVERPSQKPIVIGRGGTILKEVGTAVRRQMPEGAYLELFVRVEKHWQQRDEALDRLGL
jgi:GTP-binding protein Era